MSDAREVGNLVSTIGGIILLLSGSFYILFSWKHEKIGDFRECVFDGISQIEEQIISEGCNSFPFNSDNCYAKCTYPEISLISGSMDIFKFSFRNLEEVKSLTKM